MLDTVVTDAGHAGQAGHAAVHLPSGDPGLNIPVSRGAAKLAQT